MVHLKGNTNVKMIVLYQVPKICTEYRIEEKNIKKQ